MRVLQKKVNTITMKLSRPVSMVDTDHAGFHVSGWKSLIDRHNLQHEQQRHHFNTNAHNSRKWINEDIICQLRMLLHLTYAQYILAKKVEFDTFNFVVVDKVKCVGFDFVASVDAHLTLSTVLSTKRWMLTPLSTKPNELNMFNFGDKF